MCLAIPAKIAQLDGDGMATVDILAVTRSVTIDLIKEFPDLAGDELPAATA